MRVALLYDRDALAGDKASQDVREELAAVGAALRRAGHETLDIGVDLDVAEFKRELVAFGPDAAFNLVESLDGSDRLQTVVPLLLESWGVSFTGCGSFAMQLSNHKLASKQALARAGLPVPRCLWLGAGGKPERFPADGPGSPPSAWIIKPLESHASLHMDDSAVIAAETGRVAGLLAEREERHGQAFFAEEFLDGREFNLSMVRDAAGHVHAFPPSEIRFDDLPAGKPRIVGYAAKWDEDSPEYRGTPRSFDFAPGDAGLLERLAVLAREGFAALGLSGYARADFRTDASGRPYILEVNANPCISPDAGLVATAAKYGWEYDRLCREILAAALQPAP